MSAILEAQIALERAQIVLTEAGAALSVVDLGREAYEQMAKQCLASAEGAEQAAAACKRAGEAARERQRLLEPLDEEQAIGALAEAEQITRCVTPGPWHETIGCAPNSRRKRVIVEDPARSRRGGGYAIASFGPVSSTDSLLDGRFTARARTLLPLLAKLLGAAMAERAAWRLERAEVAALLAEAADAHDALNDAFRDADEPGEEDADDFGEALGLVERLREMAKRVLPAPAESTGAK